MQFDIEHFKKLENILVVIIAAGGINPTVAGGAVRDSILEKPISDIDVFYQGDLDLEGLEKHLGKKEEKETFPECPKINWLLPPNSPELEAQILAQDTWHEKYNQYEESFSVNNYKGDAFNFNGMKLQLIKVADVDEHISSFPCYLSRMLFSEGNLVIPIEALQDASLKIVRFTDECNEKYKEKISMKYEDYL